MATSTSAEGKSRKRTTLGDLVAAAKVGAIDLSTEVVPTSELADEMDAQYAAGVAATVAATQSRSHDERPSTDKNGTEHECAIPGCRHGAAHGPSQPDRQLKLACPNCGAVARMTNRAFQRSGGIVCIGDGGTFAVAARRTYNRTVSK